MINIKKIVNIMNVIKSFIIKKDSYILISGPTELLDIKAAQDILITRLY